MATSTERSRRRRERLRQERLNPVPASPLSLTPEEVAIRRRLVAYEADDPVAKFLAWVQAQAHPQEGDEDGRPSAETLALAQRAAQLSEKARAIREPMAAQETRPTGLVVPGQGGQYQVGVRESDVTRMAYRTLDVVLATLPHIAARDVRAGLRAALSIINATRLTFEDTSWADFYAAAQGPEYPDIPDPQPFPDRPTTKDA